MVYHCRLCTRFLFCEVTPLPLLPSLFERKHMEFSVGLTVLGAEHAQNYLKSFLGDLSFFPFIHFSTCVLFLSVWIHAQLFFTFGCTVLFTLLALHSNSALAPVSQPFWVLFVYCSAFPSSLAVRDDPDSCFNSSYPSRGHMPKEPFSFHWEWT